MSTNAVNQTVTTESTSSLPNKTPPVSVWRQVRNAFVEAPIMLTMTPQAFCEHKWARGENDLNAPTQAVFMKSCQKMVEDFQELEKTMRGFVD